MIPLRHCAGCQRFFAPENRSQWLCDNCTTNAMSKTIVWWFFAFALMVIGLLIWMLI